MTLRRTRSGAKTISVQEFQLDGMAIKLTYKTMRSLTLRLKTPDGPIEVSAPVGTSRLAVESFVRSRKPWIDIQRARLADKPLVRANAASPEEVKEWRALVEGLTPGLVGHWAQIMGVTPGKLVYRNMTSRWGSCRPSTGRICINVRLALYPPRCLEYVVVHELAHLVVQGHGPQFRALLDRYLPDWRATKRLLS